MRHSRRSKKPKKDNPNNIVRNAIRRATNLPPAHCMATFRTIASYAHHRWGRNAFASIKTIAKENNTSERSVQEQMAILRDGKWIDTHEPDNPKAYVSKYPDPSKRANCYRIV